MAKLVFDQFIQQQIQLPYFKELMNKLDKEYECYNVYPPKQQLLRCFENMEVLKVVILGQDPYHQYGQANGLAFSVNKGIKIPPSLKNIYKELRDDLGIETPPHGDLSPLVNEGVLLLNNILSVQDSLPNSHLHIGWQQFVEETIQYINQLPYPVVFILWGKNALKQKKLITNPNHFVIEGVHPSPLSAYRGFFGSKPFSKANTYLEQQGIKKVDWGVINV